jgi:hypothetical protein
MMARRDMDIRDEGIERPMGGKAIGALFDFLVGHSVEQIAQSLEIDVPSAERLLRHALVTYGFSAQTSALSTPTHD